MSYFSNPLSFFTIEWKDGAKIQEILSSIYTRLHRCLLWTSCSGETTSLCMTVMVNIQHRGKQQIYQSNASSASFGSLWIDN